MKHNYRAIDMGFLCGILLLLFLPLLQTFFHFKKSIRPLRGAYVAAEDTLFTWKGWFDERFQQKKNDKLNQDFGFRNYYVRLNNQLDFTLFEKINTEHVVQGKAGVLYEDDYIKAYLGKNFIGKEKLEALGDKLKQAQQLLKSNGIRLEILFLPGKASFFPEYIPDTYGAKSGTSNYEYLSQYAKKIGLDFIDFNAWFKQMKPHTVYDLYPSGGIHWSNYGALIAFDSLRKHIEKNSLLTLREFRITKIKYSSTLIDPDNDIGEALNLMRDVKPLSMPYAEYKWLEKPLEDKPQALFVGDSYFWNWYYQGLINNFFTNARFWYYNQTVFPDTLPERDVQKLSFKESVAPNKVVVLMATESNIHDIGWGFADKVLSNFTPGQGLEHADSTTLANLGQRKNIYIKFFIGEIKKNADWLEKVKIKAKEKNISADAMALLDAEYLYDTQYSQPSVIQYTEETKQRILHDAKWSGDVKAKAKEKNIPFEEMLELDAKYIYDMEVSPKK